jgi:hypothetical protein
MLQDSPAKPHHVPSVDNNTAARRTFPFIVTFVEFGVAKIVCVQGRDITLVRKKVTLNVIPYATNAMISF